MLEQTVDLSKVTVDPVKADQYKMYDQVLNFSSPGNKAVFDAADMNNPGHLLDLHDFMPWGWGLNFPILRDFNVRSGVSYKGATSFYAMKGIKFKPNRDSNLSFLEQLADQWLAAYSSKNKNKKILLMGTSLGALFAAVVASRAKAFSIHVDSIYLNEPAGVTPKSLLKIRQQVTRDTKFEFDYSAKVSGKRGKKLDIAKYLISNLSNERKTISEIAKGHLAKHVNNYLLDNDGHVHIFHGAGSSLISSEDLKVFHARIDQPNKLNYNHILEVKHGVGPHFRELAVWLMGYITTHQ